MSTDTAPERGWFDGPVLVPAPDADALRDLRRAFPEWDIQRFGRVYTSLRRSGTVEEFHVAPTVADLAVKLRGAP